MDKTTKILVVLIIYLVATLIIGIWSSKIKTKKESKNDFLNNYFIGGRSMGGIVLAMTLVATFTSASSFIGGPGVAFSKGLVWVYLSVIQIPTAFIILALLGKKFAIISRKTGAVTVTDYLRARYKSNAVVIISSICLVLFFIAQMMSQFIGGAVLFQTVTGLNYTYGLALFGIIVIIYTSIGGFKAVVMTDTIQGIVMLIGAIIMLFTVIKAAGGYTNMIEVLNQNNSHWTDITSNGNVAKSFVLSFWVLVGIGVLGLPQTAVRGMGFKDTKSLHNAIIYGTIVVGFLMLVMHLAGVFSNAVLIDENIISPDYVIPTIVLKYMNPILAGIFIAAPLAAVMSTVSSLLLLSSAAIVKDIYVNYIIDNKINDNIYEKKVAKISFFTTLILGIIVFIFTIYPPDLIVWINLFALGGLECAFFCPILFGLYWKKANSFAVIFSQISGVCSFIIFTITKFSLIGSTPIVPSIIIAIITFIIGSLIGKETDKKTIELFF